MSTTRLSGRRQKVRVRSNQGHRRHGEPEPEPAGAATRREESRLRVSPRSQVVLRDPRDRRAPHADPSGPRRPSRSSPPSGPCRWGDVVPIGSRHETRRHRRGAHLLEHLLFRVHRTPGLGFAGHRRRRCEGVGGEIQRAFTARGTPATTSELLDEHLDTSAVDVLSPDLCWATRCSTAFRRSGGTPAVVTSRRISPWRAKTAAIDLAHRTRGAAVQHGHPLGTPVAGTADSVTGHVRRRHPAALPALLHPGQLCDHRGGQCFHIDV